MLKINKAQILKNLILPGVSSFTIVDASNVRGEDAGNNFFLSRDSIGKSKARITTTSLLELNTDVAGKMIDQRISHRHALAHIRMIFVMQ